MNSFTFMELPSGGAGRCWIRGLMILVLVAHASVTGAEPLPIQGALTALESDTDRMISYRHEEHSWVTGDGALHVLVNRGGLGVLGMSLVLYSSSDGGRNWTAGVSLPATNKLSTADGELLGNNLSLVYSSLTGKLIYTVLRYDGATRVWSTAITETAFSHEDALAINPALVTDDSGAVWCAFVGRDAVTKAYGIRLSRRDPERGSWEDTGLVFGSVDGDSIERSARPVRIPGGVGMVYTVHEKVFWAYRLNGWAATTPWREETLFTSSEPYDLDPYASHFSVAGVEGSLHLAFSDHGRLLYMRYRGSTGSWDAVRTLSLDIQAGYLQTSVTPGAVWIFANIFGSVGVMQSTDGGDNFKLAYTLRHDVVADPVAFAHPRIETPREAGEVIPVLQQYVEGDVQRLLYFDTPSLPPAGP